jgi:hypothetical protein
VQPFLSCSSGATPNTDAFDLVALELVRHYFSSFGLVERHAAVEAAKRVVSALHREHIPQGARPERAAMAVARRWIEDFARRAYGSGPDWFFRIPELLRRFPRTFLETEVPSTRTVESTSMSAILPRDAPARMRTQEISGPCGQPDHVPQPEPFAPQHVGAALRGHAQE